jgi:uncharacterized protein YdiU (UPF0061 family)
VPIEEACAMTTRVSPSFIRIGHFDLFGRLIDGSIDDDDDLLFVSLLFYMPAA